MATASKIATDTDLDLDELTPPADELLEDDDDLTGLADLDDWGTDDEDDEDDDDDDVISDLLGDMRFGGDDYYGRYED